MNIIFYLILLTFFKPIAHNKPLNAVLNLDSQTNTTVTTLITRQTDVTPKKKDGYDYWNEIASRYGVAPFDPANGSMEEYITYVIYQMDDDYRYRIHFETEDGTLIENPIYRYRYGPDEDWIDNAYYEEETYYPKETYDSEAVYYPEEFLYTEESYTDETMMESDFEIPQEWIDTW